MCPKHNNVQRKLGARLEAVCAMLGTANCVADIGCDHGLVSASLLESNAAKRVIASDISVASLDKARRLAIEQNLISKLTCRLSNGFSAYILGECDKAVISGMGGELIVSILKEGIEFARSLDYIVMQPMRGETELREYLWSNGFCVKDEVIIQESGRYYQLIGACSGEASTLPPGWPKDFWQFGPVAFAKHEPLLPAMLQRYYSIIAGKLKAAEAKGQKPPSLVYEMECILKLMEMYDMR